MTPDYLAGYIDGEGSFYIYAKPRKPGFICGLQIAGIYKPTILKLREQFGGSFYAMTYHRHQTRQCWGWSASGKGAYKVCQYVQGRLYEKHEQAELLMRFWEWRQRQEYRPDWSEAQAMADKIKALKWVEYT